ncbi:hypothetical protein DRJ00_06360 [Candidatus Aerophobetes bacterium]|uniref:Permease n=1 Tax=Aerophobetes bacterium TaxID=2030807 RepID=A0A497E2X2_UNCAE|nr:MAG: hypothetical protein DRJ00_06360 [Candidatus Aerophobetes bacterium]
MNEKLKSAMIKSARSIFNSLPILVGAILLIGLASTLMPKSYYAALFSKNILLDSIIGSGLGSVLAGNPITSYVLGGEFLKQGISLVAVTSFLVAWVTVGLVQLPAEALLLGRKFAILRNILSFLLSIIVAIITVFIVGLL